MKTSLFTPLKYKSDESLQICQKNVIFLLSGDGRVLSWGRSDYGQLGHGDFENGRRPKLLEFFEGFKIKRVSAGWNHSAFVTGFCHIKFETSVCYVLLLDIDCFLYFLL